MSAHQKQPVPPALSTPTQGAYLKADEEQAVSKDGQQGPGCG